MDDNVPRVPMPAPSAKMERADRLFYAKVLLGVWGLLAIVMGNQYYNAVQSSGGHIGWFHAVIFEFTYALQWVVLAPVSLWLIRRFPFAKRRWPLSFVVHVAAGLCFSSLTMAGRAVIHWAVVDGFGTPLSWEMILKSMTSYFDYGIMSYLLILLVGAAYEYSRRLRATAFETSRLETQLARAQLQSLRSQLQPHFLFNTLHAIAVLIRKQQTDAAVKMIGGLSELLRVALEQRDTQEVPFRDELTLLDRYLEIEAVRFSDRLAIERRIDDDTLDLFVPSLSLQPLVENAVRHGIAKIEGPGHISISCSRTNGMLVLRVEDNGPGIASELPSLMQQGIGLSNTVERIRHLYGEHATLSLANRPEGGAAAELRIPMRERRSAGEGTVRDA